MKLYIDTSDNKKTVIKLGSKLFTKTYTSPRDQAVLKFLDEILSGESVGLDEISEIEVYPGPGSFTGIRVGVAVAQALAFALDIPINGETPTKRILEINYEK